MKDKTKFLIWDILSFIVIIAIVATIGLAIYGMRTDCPNTEGYVYCGNQ